ncbi:hypothetical protein mRhiFer1_008414 [Rhinolophus ferrumequinum]|uniref:Uncharacterized protein n=1 Tax=Rhinolophus ferrumequinum TaxID=59479 RepID=A0A7J7V7X9_RHIFE|nr:hypothetical protein mRhiFer1_008414 [Rhinolophus ferrumequinum]
MRALQQGTLEGLKKSTLQTLPGGNISRISTFTVLHPAFSRAQQVLDQLLPGAIASMVGTWPDRVQYCGQPLLLPWSKLKRALVQVDSPVSHLGGHVHLLWVELENLEPSEAELEGTRRAGTCGNLSRYPVHNDLQKSRTLHSLRNNPLWGQSLVRLGWCWSQWYL